MPGGGFKKSGRMVKKHIQEITEKPLAFTMHQRAENQHTVSYASDLLDQNESHNSVAWTSMGMYIAGADTVRQLTSFYADWITDSRFEMRRPLLH